MIQESHGTDVIDEIDRLLVAYEKAKQYVSEVSLGIEQQLNTWQNRRQIIFDQQTQSKSSSFEFLLPKTQRINDLALEAVTTLCRASLLFEQILRVEPKPFSQPIASRARPPSSSFSARPLDPVFSNPTSNTMTPRVRHPVPSPLSNSVKQQPQFDPIINDKSSGQYSHPMPVLRTLQQQQSQSPSGRSSAATTQEKTGFKPIELQQSSNAPTTTPRPTPIHPQTTPYPATEGLTFSGPTASSRGSTTSQSDRGPSPAVLPVASQQRTQYPQEKVKVKLQRIAPSTKWEQATIGVIDSLSAFYVENTDTKIQGKLRLMLQDLYDHYNHLEEIGALRPLNDVSIGDFCVAKYSVDDCWYRARIIMCEENNQMRIVFIDYGNIETKSVDEFFPLDKKFANISAQAVACTLSKAYPRTLPATSPIWSEDTIQIFKELVSKKTVKVDFVRPEQDTEQWPLHFVEIIVDNQSVTSFLDLKQRIDPRPNGFIAGQLAPSLSHSELILFNVPISDDEIEQ